MRRINQSCVGQSHQFLSKRVVKQIRQFVGATLKSMPVASLEGLRFERKKVGDTRLEAQIRLTVYFRPATEGDAS